MAEYIDKNKAINAVFEAFADGRSAYIALESIPAADVVPGSDFRDCRNELCLRCGQYKTSHLGSCNGCRWEKI